MNPPPFSRAAQAYARLGIAVFPLREREKKPLAYSTGLLAASTDPDLAAARWAGQASLPVRPPKEPGERLPDQILAHGRCNVACATGAVSGFWVLDLDGPDAEEDLAKLVAVHGELPETVEQGTGKGRHLCFAWDPAFEVRNSASKIGRGIDVRGDGGYIVLPPSIHPSGRAYAWTPGRSPRDRAFAAAPSWLLQLVCPPAPAAAEARPARPTERLSGTTKFGQATLNTSCAEVATTPPGQQQSKLFGYAAFIGAYVAGGEIDEGQAREALIDAGLRMVAAKGAWTRKEVESAVVRGMEKGAKHPKTAPAPQPLRTAGDRAVDARRDKPVQAAQAAGAILDARRLWDGARPADCRAVRSWFAAHNLDPEGLPGGLGSLRAHARAPIGDGAGPALLIPLLDQIDGDEWNREIEALAILPLQGSRVARFVGPARDRVACLSTLPADGALLVALDFCDAWTLGQNAWESGHELGVILAPTLRAFAGEALGDRWGRIDPATPHADPDNPPWTLEGARPVFLAVRGDLRSGEHKRRRTLGGTQRLQLQGEAAARFFGGLADQAWRRAGANPVRILRPSTGVGFSEGRRGA
ncbi:MAG: bifunctional DNA primase/polymerase [Phenylobacterium sp.]|uniref:bifunctional DNA primase/polymerase n=1 Tax=Phenylobacterium sp. TaxID=1871053 RepID=UPI0027364BAD|nr:bifunctional DNA primase/polymerase [Phenylobacterium sp.]MDP1642735.1 bifunctional DNA primase/polymerase [Phenylobacterium sp.]MDP3117217.1 bifunctional DNA primase/polymerase [Phenylobacterium sp.]